MKNLNRVLDWLTTPIDNLVIVLMVISGAGLLVLWLVYFLQDFLRSLL
jgi:hypothetical protein